jgi:hypothetical protein
VQIFLDTEFTSLAKDGYACLISIGLVAHNGEEFYAELSDTWNRSLCSQFVIETVLPLLQGGEYLMTEDKLAFRLRDWIDSIEVPEGEEIILRSDAPGVDWPFVEQLFTFYGAWPKKLRRTPGSINLPTAAHNYRFEEALAAYWRENAGKQHHALEDCRALRLAWKAAIKRGISK